MARGIEGLRTIEQGDYIALRIGALSLEFRHRNFCHRNFPPIMGSAENMIAAHESFEPPEDRNIPLWRYLDLPKFLNLLQTNQLYFPRADLLGDPFEGSMTLASVTLWREALADEEKCRAIFSGMDQTAARSMVEYTSAFIERNVKNNFISCWHANKYESAAMWAQYARQGEAIALQTTFEKLSHELPDEVLMGLVRYIDYDREFISIHNLFNPFLRKRRSFEHEKEVRAIVWSLSGSLKDRKSADGRVHVGELGVNVSVDLKKFLDRVLVGPAAPEWFVAVVEDVAKRYNLNVPVMQSSLAAKPVY